MHASVIYVRIVLIVFKGMGCFEPLLISVGGTLNLNHCKAYLEHKYLLCSYTVHEIIQKEFGYVYHLCNAKVT